MKQALSIPIDTQSFMDFNLKINQANEKAMFRMMDFLGRQIIADALTIPPTPRIDTGQARGSWSIKIGSLPVKYSDGSIGSYTKPSGMLSPEISGMNKFDLRVGFNVPYAYNIHEGEHEDGREMKFGIKSQNATPRTGNFFLSSKIKTREKIWMKRSSDLYNDFLKQELK
jgi:hypothetical protein